MRRATLAIVVVLVVAGCLGGADPAETPATTPSPQSTPTPTADATPAPDTPGPNPYGKSELLVYVNASLVDRDVSPVVDESFRYWEAHEGAAGYPVTFTRTDDPDAADVHLTFASVYECGQGVDTSNTHGCATVPGDRAPETVTATVDPTLSTPMLQQMVTHELGHTLGVTHSSDLQVMTPEISPLEFDEIPVYIGAPDGETVSQTERAEVEQALAWYATHPDLDADERPSWTFVDDPADATVTITLADDVSECDSETGGVCTGAPQYSDQYALRVESVEESTTAFYVAAAMWPAFFDHEQPPAELTAEASYSDRVYWPE